MLKLESFKKANLGLIGITSFLGGRSDVGVAIGCVDCAGSTTYCPNSSTCVKIDCPKGNDVGGNEALGCGSSVTTIGQTTI